jgi:peroxiredoxin
VLVFYPFAFTGVCSGELHALQDERSELDNDRVALLAVSTDSMYSLRVFAEKEGFDFAMLSDFWPHGEVAAAYGVLNEAVGAAMRGTFVIDRDGVVRWTVLHGLGDARDVEDYKKALAEL